MRNLRKPGCSMHLIILLIILACLGGGVLYFLVQIGVVPFPKIISYTGRCDSEPDERILIKLIEPPQTLAEAISRPGRLALLCADGSGEISYSFPKGLQGIDVAISPDNMRVAFREISAGHHVFIANQDNTSAIRVFSRFQAEDSYSWSPDGRYLAFRAHDKTTSGLYTVDVACLNERKTCDSQVQYLGSGDNPVWSPDGTKIAFEDKDDKGQAIFVMQSDGTERTKVFSSIEGGGSPRWTPDSQSLYFFLPLSPEGIYQLNLSDSSLKFLVPGLEACWMPEGKRIAYTSVKDNPTLEGFSRNSERYFPFTHLYIFDITSGEEYRLNTGDRQFIDLDFGFNGMCPTL